MTAGKQILLSLIIGVIVGFIIGFIAPTVGSSWGIFIVVVLGLTAIIGYLTMTEKSVVATKYVADDAHGEPQGVDDHMKMLNVRDDVTLSGDDARKWLDDLIVKQQSEPKS